MKLLLDEQLSPLIAAALRERGHDAVAVRERKWRNTTERAVWEKAIEDERTVVTCDGEDLPSLYALSWQAKIHHAGLIVISPRLMEADDVAGVVAALEDLLRRIDKTADQIFLLRSGTTGR
jgi:predicted nuclease of predicted toxin-antitoxin system